MLYIILRGFYLWRFDSIEELLWYIIGSIIFIIVSSIIITIFSVRTDAKKKKNKSATIEEKPWKQTLRKLFESDNSKEMY